MFYIKNSVPCDTSYSVNNQAIFICVGWLIGGIGVLQPFDTF